MCKIGNIFKSIYVAGMIFVFSFMFANQSNGGNITIAEGIKSRIGDFQVNEVVEAEENGFVVVNVEMSDSAIGSANVFGIVNEGVRSSATVWSFAVNAGFRPPSDFKLHDSFTMPVVIGEEWEVTVEAAPSDVEFNVSVEFISFP